MDGLQVTMVIELDELEIVRPITAEAGERAGG